MSKLLCWITTLLVFAATASAQTVRFETTVGNFDMVLNPNGIPDLQEHVDNLLHYVTTGLYDHTVINRADHDFVVQMGNFKTADATVPATVNGFLLVDAYPLIAGAPAQQFGLSNTRGMVGMALRGNGQGGTDRDSATNSFYVNLGDNSFLDPDFAIFAQIPNMATIDAINALQHVNLTANPNFGSDPGNLAFTDVPLQPNGNLVLINRAFVVPEPTTSALVGCALATLVATFSYFPSLIGRG